jgi:RimJ/RimL family protein N-acetyltransferase
MGKIDDRIVKTKSGKEITLTTLQPGEGAALLECVKRIMATSEHLLTTAEEFSYTAEQEDDLLRSFLDHPDKVIIAPKINGRIIGMMDFKPGARKKNSHQGELGMSVHPNFRGEGIGRHMLETLINWALKNPRIETLRLRVFSKNKNAHQLYKSCGFIEEGRELQGVKLSDGTYDDIICMARNVR